jgi:ankyrin repeat protein
MLEHGADPNLAPSDPGSVLDMAAEIGTVAAVDLLLQHGAKLENSTPLHNAASMGHHGAARLSRVLPSEYLAIVGDRIPMMKYLLEHGVDVNGLDDPKSPYYRIGTPLHYAITQGGLTTIGVVKIGRL